MNGSPDALITTTLASLILRAYTCGDIEAEISRILRCRTILTAITRSSSKLTKKINMEALKWKDLNLSEQTLRINELRSAVNRNGRKISDDLIVEVLCLQNYLPTDKNVRLLIDGTVNIDQLRNTRSDI